MQHGLELRRGHGPEEQDGVDQPSAPSLRAGLPSLLNGCVPRPAPFLLILRHPLAERGLSDGGGCVCSVAQNVKSKDRGKVVNVETNPWTSLYLATSPPIHARLVPVVMRFNKLADDESGAFVLSATHPW